MSNIDFSRMETAETRAARARARFRGAGQVWLRQAIEAAADQLTGAVSLAERLSWDAKAAAAAAFLDGGASPEQVALLAAEADRTGETLEALAACIREKARRYRQAASLLAGLRRSYAARIEAAASEAETDALLTEVREALATSFAAA